MRRSVNDVLTLIFAFFHFVDLTLQQSPTFISQEGYHVVRVGTTVVLPCRVKDLGYDYIVFWTKGTLDTTTIIADRQTLIDDPRIQHAEEDDDNLVNWDFQISKVEPNDEGIYQCQISTDPPLVQKQMLSVNVPAFVHIVPEKNPYTIKVGQSIQLTCHPSGNPVPTVVWTKIGSLLPDGLASYDGETLHVDSAESKHEGVYRCTGTNEVSVTHADIKVQVTSAPEVYTSKNIIFVNLGASINVSCIYKANPDPTVEWIFNGFPLEVQSKENRDRMNIVNVQHKNDSVTTLFVDKIDTTEFGDYTCRITNNIGRAETTIHISSVPGPAQLMLREKGPELSWIIESADPVLEFQIEYRTTGQDHYQKIKVPTDGIPKKDSLYKGVYVFDNLEPNQKYEIMVRGRNVNGWGKSPLKPITLETDKFYKPAKTATTEKDKSVGTKKPGSGGKGPTKLASRHFLSTFVVFWCSLSVFCLTKIFF